MSSTYSPSSDAPLPPVGALLRNGTTYTAVQLKDGRVLEVKKNGRSGWHNMHPSLEAWYASIPEADRATALDVTPKKSRRVVPTYGPDYTLVRNAVVAHYPKALNMSNHIGQFYVYGAYGKENIVALCACQRLYVKLGDTFTALAFKDVGRSRTDGSELMAAGGKVGKTFAELGIPVDASGKPDLWIQLDTNHTFVKIM